eukprot:1169789-Ditylum_brightwellii.AAC.1
MKTYEVDVFTFAETNTAWTPQAQHRAKKITKQLHKKNYRIETSLSNEMAVNQYQPGGTMIGVVGKQQGRILDGNQDKSGLGGLSYMVMTGQLKNVYIVLAYRVAQGKNDSIQTAYTQQY